MSGALEAGDAVFIKDDISEARQLQEGHGGWNEEMAPVGFTYVFNHIMAFVSLIHSRIANMWICAKLVLIFAFIDSLFVSNTQL